MTRDAHPRERAVGMDVYASDVAVVAELAAGATDPYAVLDVATATRALATTNPGALPSFPDREAVDALVADDGIDASGFAADGSDRDDDGGGA